MGLAEIIKTEKIELDKDEMESAKQRVAHQLSHQKGGTPDMETRLTEQVTQGMRIDKYISSIMI